jgi:hypothetical protein
MSDKQTPIDHHGPVAPQPGIVKREAGVGRFLMKGTLSILFVLFGLWLLMPVYLPQTEPQNAVALARPAEEGGIFVKILSEQQLVPKGHFHMVDEHIDQPEPYQPLCLNCHGTYPHRKEKKIRALLNFHGGIMACTVCHVRREPGHKGHFFVWVNRTSGAISKKAEGSFGKYPAKIFPMKKDANGEPSILRPVSEKDARQFLKLKDQFTPDQMARAKIKLHEGLSQKPVFCTECHKKDGYFDFAELGFAQNRVDNLTSNEIARMINNYETFYMPETIDFSAP